MSLFLSLKISKHRKAKLLIPEVESCNVYRIWTVEGQVVPRGLYLFSLPNEESGSFFFPPRNWCGRQCTSLYNSILPASLMTCVLTIVVKLCQLLPSHLMVAKMTALGEHTFIFKKSQKYFNYAYLHKKKEKEKRFNCRISSKIKIMLRVKIK